MYKRQITFLTSSQAYISLVCMAASVFAFGTQVIKVKLERRIPFSTVIASIFSLVFPMNNFLSFYNPMCDVCQIYGSFYFMFPVRREGDQ